MNATGYTPEEPIAAIATALSPAALGIIRVSGKNAIELVSQIFSRPQTLKTTPGNTVVYGWIQDSTNNFYKIDEVLVSVFRGPKSFTGEDMAEISCHGGIAVVTEIFKLLLKIGFRQANPGEFTFRAFINGKADLTKAEAVQEIVSAKTSDSRGHATDRLAGNLYREIDDIKHLLVTTLAAIEAEIEYPEDEETIADAFDPKNLQEARRRLSSLIHSWASEKLYQDGAKIVLCGKTNAGKSSLFNTLLKEERAIVSDIHGTTRDWIESWASFAGIPARLFDTAGLRESEDVIEQHGIQRTKDLTQDADLILYVLDGTEGLSQEDEVFLLDFLSAKNTEIPIIIVINKADRLADCTKILEAVKEKLGNLLVHHNIPLIPVSAKKGEGIDLLVQKTKELLVSDISTTRETVGLGSQRQKCCTEEALESVVHALEAAGQGYSLDAVVQDIEDALDSLGEITGSVTPEDILDTVFSKFCLGK